MTTATDALARVQALCPLVAEHADAAEQARSLPAPVVDALVGAEIFRLLIPQVLGGLEADPITACQVVEELSTIDGATGWCAMIGSGYGQFAGLLEEPAAKAIFGDPRAVVAGAFRPNGVARAVAGGYRVSGRWPFGSGIHHAT